MTSEQRARELFDLKVTEIPPLAVEYAKILCGKAGGCAEVVITAYNHYAQLEENLKSKDSLYKVTEEDIELYKRIKK